MPKRILIVDDDPDLVEAVSMLLEAAGMEPLAAYGGVEGLEKAKNEDPDLIVLDVMMPDKDGYAVAKELAKDAKLSEIPLIMLTAVVDHIGSTHYSHADRQRPGGRRLFPETGGSRSPGATDHRTGGLKHRLRSHKPGLFRVTVIYK
jgi:two-component system alkaline phosphatase synthesis response regulator PhoP